MPAYFEDFEAPDTTETFERQSRLMTGISEILTRLTQVPPGSAADIPSLLAILGEAAEVDRVYVFENSREAHSGRLLHSQRYEWVRGSVSVQLDNPELQDVPYEFVHNECLPALERGECFTIQLDEAEGWIRKEMDREQILSLLFAPIILPEGLWGFVGFDDCHRMRRWSEAERNALKAMGGALGSAIARQRTEELMHALADNITQFAWMAESDGAIFWLNRRWYEYTGTAPHEMTGWGWKSVHHPEYRDRVVAHYLEHVQRGEAWEDTFPLRGKDGHYRWFLSRAVPIRDEAGEVVRWFGTHTDVTELREHEEELNRLNEALRREIEERTTLTEQLRDLTTELTMAEQRERWRIAEVLHENVQQILAGCKFALASLASKSTNQEAKTSIGEVQSQLDQAIEMSRSLAVELAPPELYQLGLSAGLRSLALAYQSKFGLTVDVRLEQGVEVERDEDRVFLYFSARELLLNVVKHAETDRAELSLTQQGGMVTLTVRDDGRGCELPRNEEYGSKVGFGIFRIRQRLEPLNGSLQMESAPHRGCEVTIAMPVTPTPDKYGRGVHAAGGET